MIRLAVVLGYLMDGVAAIVLGLVSRLRPGALSSFADLLDQVMASRPARIALLLFWWWLGWHFFVVPPEDG
jgi:hypothetical protein